MWLQSFEVGNLKALSHMTSLRRVQLLEADGAPYDLVLAGDSRGYADLMTPAGLAGIAGYAQAIGPPKAAIIPRRFDDSLGEPTQLVTHAHQAGLAVHPWTFRAENSFLPRELRLGTDPAAHGQLQEEICRFLGAGIDGFFTDQPDIGFAARAAFARGARA